MSTTAQAYRFFGVLSLCAILGGCGSAHIKKAELGYDSYYAGELDQAEEDFNAALKKVGNYEPALTGLGFVAYDRGDYEAAKGFFDQAIAAEPTADAHWGRGRAQLKLFQWEAARKDLKGSASAGMVEANLDLGITLMLMGDGEGALAALEAYSRAESMEVYQEMQAVQTVYRVGLKYGLAQEAYRVASLYSFEDETLEYEEHSRVLVDLAYHSRDYSQAMREARRAPDSLSFGLVVRELSPVAKRSFEGVGGAVIDAVHVGSPAQRAGIRAGDILTGIETVPVVSAQQFQEALAEMRAKSEQQEQALIEVLRGETYLATFMNMGDFRFDQAIRDARDGGSVMEPMVAADDLAMWP